MCYQLTTTGKLTAEHDLTRTYGPMQRRSVQDGSEANTSTSYFSNGGYPRGVFRFHLGLKLQYDVGTGLDAPKKTMHYDG